MKVVIPFWNKTFISIIIPSLVAHVIFPPILLNSGNSFMVLPDLSPLSALQLSQLQQLTAQLNTPQKIWVSGYIAGLNQSTELIQPTPASEQRLTILYATQTGNSKGVALQLAEQADHKGIRNHLVSMADYKVKSIKGESHLIIVTSTNGEGEPPDDAIDLHQFLATKKAPKLETLKFAVLGLGDSSYQFFCQTGKDFEQRLLALGAEVVTTRLDADIDYQQASTQWIQQALADIQKTLNAGISTTANVSKKTVTRNKYDKQHPFSATFLSSQKITGSQSNKDVRHIEISLQGSDLTYRAGDALGVYFKNDANLVAQLITKLGLDDETPVSIDEKMVSLSDALTTHYEITNTHPAFIEAYAKQSNNPALLQLAENKEALREFANKTQVIDIITNTPAEAITPQNFIALLRRISPRLYSIASSQSEVDDEVHLTVGIVNFENKQGTKRFGGASSFLGERLQEEQEVDVFIEENHNFRLPENPQIPIIMVGPGTGIAPFRAFIQEREVTQSSGKNWLIFGDQTFNEDFLYQNEWLAYLKSGLLTKLDLAFSRDQKEKIYVQDRLKENAQEVYQWLQDGAHFYVCGDANRMAKDVHTTLIEIISKQGNKSLEDAQQELNELRQAKRYQKDVY